MARVNIYLPDELAEGARAEGLNVSALARAAVESELAAHAASEWLGRVAQLPSRSVGHADVVAAVAAARKELEGDIGG